MRQGAESGQVRLVYCVVPRDLAPKLHEPLRRHFLQNPDVQVVVEQRGVERRQSRERRKSDSDATAERRQIRNVGGRRVADRRGPAVEVAALPLPRKARPYAERLAFIECLTPGSEHAEDIDTARLVTRIQAGVSDEFAALYTRYFDRVYTYLQLMLRDTHAAEDGTQQVFMKVLEGLPRYERRGQPFRAWLFTIVRNWAIDQLKERARTEPTATAILERRRAEEESEVGLEALSWISDPDLMLFIERLPLEQRQVLLMRFMLDLSHMQIAEILGRKPDDVRAMHSRAIRFLRDRLTAVGRAPHRRGTAPMQRARGRANVLRARRFALH